MKSRGGFDWVDTVSKIAGALGFNAVRIRWKLSRWRDSAKTSVVTRVDTAKHVGYEHRMCPECGRLQDGSEKKCLNCGHSFTPRHFDFLNRIGLVVPHLASLSTVLCIAIIACYVRTAIAAGEFFSFDGLTLIAFGGSYSSFVLGGEWWRLLTSVFLHAGILHLGFNLVALEEIGPTIEDVFGRARFFFFFIFTGICASAFSLVWRHYLAGTEGVAIGASGAIMGLVGVAAGWGHKDGTTIGRDIRNMMLKWGAYTVVFGLVIGADNAAHVSGFACGAVIGLLSQPRRRKSHSTLTWVLALVAAAAAVASVVLIFAGPHTQVPL